MKLVIHNNAGNLSDIEWFWIHRCLEVWIKEYPDSKSCEFVWDKLELSVNLNKSKSRTLLVQRAK